ncbi:MAG: rhodanese-like domain-containing protein [Candidatus Eutrophobiaceae bacterium]
MLLTAQDMIAAAKSSCNCLNAAQAKKFADERENVLVLDVREPQEVEQSKLPTSANIPRGLLEMKIAQLCPEQDRPILVHCGAGGRASLSAHTLQIMGYTNVHVADANFADLMEQFSA